MNHSELMLLLANDRIRAEVVAAANARLAKSSSRSSIRRSVGHQIIRIGERLAEESQLQAVRSR